MADPVSVRAETVGHIQSDTVRPEEILIAISLESRRLADQVGSIQAALAGILDKIPPAGAGAEIRTLQDIDRIQQTLSDFAAILAATGSLATGPPISKDEIGAAVRLESLRARLGLAGNGATDSLSEAEPDITWL